MANTPSRSLPDDGVQAVVDKQRSIQQQQDAWGKHRRDCEGIQTWGWEWFTQRAADRPETMSAAFSASMMVGKFVLAEVICGITDASITRRLRRP